MKGKLALALGCFSCCIAFAASPASAASGPPPATTAISPLDDAGNKLANNDTQGAIRCLMSVVRAQPANPLASRLLAIALLRARQHEQAADAAETGLKQATLSADQRAVASLLLGKARYNAFLDDYEKCSSQIGFLPNVAQLLSQMATHEYPTSRGNVIVTKGDVNAQDDFEAMKTTFRDTVSRLQHRLSQADTAYQASLAADPHLAGAHDGLGLVRASQGYLGEARREFLTELSQNGPSGPLYLHLGNLDAAEHHDDDAVENLRLAITLSPEMEAPYRALIPLYTKAHDQEHAQWAKGMSELRKGDIKSAEKSLASPSPKTVDLLCGQAQLCLVQKRAADARALLMKAQSLDSKNAEAVTMLADLEEAAGHYNKAIVLYHQALDLDAAWGAAWYGLGLVYDQQNDRESALADYMQALQVNPNNSLAKLNLAADEADLGQREKAIVHLRDYEERFPTANNIYVVDSALKQLAAR